MNPQDPVSAAENLHAEDQPTQAPLVAEAHQERHEQNLRDLELIRTDPAWALSMIQKARELARQLEQVKQNTKPSGEVGEEA